LRWSYPRQHPRMASVDEPEDPEPDNQQTGADMDLSLLEGFDTLDLKQAKVLLDALAS